MNLPAHLREASAAIHNYHAGHRSIADGIDDVPATCAALDEVALTIERTARTLRTVLSWTLAEDVRVELEKALKELER